MLTLLEYIMSQAHKEAIGRARSGDHHSPQTKKKISASMAGKSNHEGKKHSRASKARISVKRGDYDPIKGKRWIVNRKDKTYRRNSAPTGYKIGQRTFEKD